MAQISRETVERVLAATDIVDLIGSYIPVKRAGSNFQALCPFHHEKSPSFSINPARQFFHCFGCKKSGDAIAFVRDYENLTFADAVKKLGSRVGIEVVEEALDPREDQQRRQRGRLLDLHREAAAFFHDLLLKHPGADHARAYLKSRGFGREMAQRWQVGWAPDKPALFLDWARTRQLRGRDLVDSGLALKSDRGPGLYPRFRDRLMFPIRNDYGDVIAFSGRQLREDPRSGKYINSPETPLFKKASVLFALDRARKAVLQEKSVLICEGQIDAISCHEQGIEHAIAPLGTAFTPQHAKTLRRYAKHAVLCFDADNAGFAAAERAFRELAAESIAVRVVRMPRGEDPDSFMRKNGPDAFRDLLAKAGDFFDFLIDRANDEQRLTGPQQRADFARETAPLLAVVADPVSRDALINHVATRLRTGVPELRGAVSRAALAAARKPRFARDDDAPPPAPVAGPAPLDPSLGHLCALALRSPEAQEFLAEQFETIHGLTGHLDGVAILENILARRPDPSSTAAVNSFLAGLDEPARLALHLHPAFGEDVPDDAVHAATEALAASSALALERQDDAIKAALADPALPIERQLELLQRAKEIAELLGNVKNRALKTDRYAPPSRRPTPETPWKNSGFRRERKP